MLFLCLGVHKMVFDHSCFDYGEYATQHSECTTQTQRAPVIWA